MQWSSEFNFSVLFKTFTAARVKWNISKPFFQELWTSITSCSKLFLYKLFHYDSNFKELLESFHVLLVHKTYINNIMMEVCKYLHELSPELLTDIFTLWKNHSNVHNIFLFGSENPRSVRFGVDETAFRASQLWQKVPVAIKNSSLLEMFKAKIELWSCDNCPCNLSKIFIANAGHIWFILLYFLIISVVY